MTSNTSENIVRILIIDDDRVDREVIGRALKKSDLEVIITEAETVDDGLRLFRRHDFDVLFLDFSMPRKNGLEMLIELKQMIHGANTPIVMMTAYDDERLAMECFDCGAQDFILKADISPGRLRRAVLNARARFKQKHNLEKRDAHLAYVSETDSATGLANQHMFDKTVETNLANASEQHSKMAILFIALDNFKELTGSAIKDAENILLEQFVNRIQSCLREHELFARIDTSKFAIALSGIDSAQHANLVATRALNVLSSPFPVAGVEININASIGISIYPNNCETAADFLKSADSAMRDAQKLGTNRASFFKGFLDQKPAGSKQAKSSGKPPGIDLLF